MSLTRQSVFAAPILCSLLLPALFLTAQGQAQSSADNKLALKASLVLTPEFCATTIQQGGFFTGKEKFEVGKAACAELEPALQGAFTRLTRVAAPPPPEAGAVVLLPKFDEAAATRRTGVTIFNKPKKDLLVVLEWTITDPSGKTVWLQTVQGTAETKGRPNGTLSKKAMTLLVEAAVKNAADQSATQMASAQELRALPPR